MAALMGGRGKFEKKGLGILVIDLVVVVTHSALAGVALLEARVAQAQKDADEVTFLERNNPFGSGNQGDIDRLNALTQELARLRDTIAAADRSGVSVNAPTVTSTDQSKKITVQNTH